MPTEPEPTPDESVPAYVRDGVARQDPETLRDIARWATELAEWKEREVDAEEIATDLGADEQIDEIDEESENGGGTIVEKRVTCGKDCDGCPHGPYRYRVTRDGEGLDWEYLGTV